MSHDCPWTLSFMTQKVCTKFQWDQPLQRCQMQVGVGKNCVFRLSRSLQLRRLTTKNVWPPATVVGVHNGAPAEECGVSSTTLVVVKV